MIFWLETFFRNVRLTLITRRNPSNSTDGLESRPYLRRPGSRFPCLPAQERSGRDVLPQRPPFSDYTAQSQQFDGRLGEPSLPEMARISISLPSCARTFR